MRLLRKMLESQVVSISLDLLIPIISLSPSLILSQLFFTFSYTLIICISH